MDRVALVTWLQELAVQVFSIAVLETKDRCSSWHGSLLVAGAGGATFVFGDVRALG